MKIIFPIVLLLCAGIWFVDGSANIDGNTTIVGTLGVIASTTLGLLIVGFVLKDYFQFLWYNDCKKSGMSYYSIFIWTHNISIVHY